MGSSAQVADAQDGAARALTASLHIFDVNGHGEPVMSEAECTDLIDTTTAGPRRAKLVYAIKTELGKPPFRTGGQFVVEHWTGVQVVGDRVRVHVSGHSSYTRTPAASQERDSTRQHQLLLVHKGDHWLAINERAASDEQG